MVNKPPFPTEGRRTLLLANGYFSTMWAKTASCFLMYRSDDAVAILDADQAGTTARAVLGFGGDVPVVATMAEALAFRPEQAIVGTAPMGGAVDQVLRGEIIECLRNGVDVISGMHTMLGDDPELKSFAPQARIWDVRRVLGPDTVSTGEGCTTGAGTVLVVGTDCNVGKMTAAVNLCRAAEDRGWKAAWAATGQTGIILRGRGIAVDHVVADFVGGAAAELVNYEGSGNDVVFVEGQGALLHPGYGGVTLGLMYGVMPDCMILAHTADREHFKRLEVPLPPLAEVIALHEGLMAPYNNARVIGVALNTHSLGVDAANRELKAVQAQTGLPCVDVVRGSPAPLIDAVERVLRGKSEIQ